MIKRIISSFTFLTLNAIGLYFVILGVQAWLAYGADGLCYVGMIIIFLCTLSLLCKNTIIHRISLAILFLIASLCLTIIIFLIQTSRPLWLGIVISVLLLFSLVGLFCLLLERNTISQNNSIRVTSGILQPAILVFAILYYCIATKIFGK